MIRKFLGWTLAIVSVFLLLCSIGIIVYGLDSSKAELAISTLQSGIVGFFVCAGLSIYLLKKRQENGNSSSWWQKTRKIVGVLLLIAFLFSIPGMHEFDAYEILPRCTVLIISYLLLRTYSIKN